MRTEGRLVVKKESRDESRPTAGKGRRMHMMGRECVKIGGLKREREMMRVLRGKRGRGRELQDEEGRERSTLDHLREIQKCRV